MVDRTQPERLTFEQALAYACSSGNAAFAATPVFGDDQERAEGVRLFIVEGDGRGSCRIRFVAGPFFSAALAANEVLADDEISAGLRELPFMATTFSEDWLSDQICSSLVGMPWIRSRTRLASPSPRYSVQTLMIPPALMT